MLDSLDYLGSDEELKAAADAADPPGEAEGRDATHSVTVRMDPSARVEDVVISPWWRSDLSAGELPGALIEAYGNALAQAVRVPERRSSPGRRRIRPIDSGLDGRDWFEEIRRANERTADNLEQAARLELRRPAERVVTGPAGIVRLVVTAGVVTAAEIDVHAAMQESPATVAADAREAFGAVR